MADKFGSVIFQGRAFSNPGGFHSVLSSTALAWEIQILPEKLLWNKVQASYPTAVTGLPDAMPTECSQQEEKLTAVL